MHQFLYLEGVVGLHVISYLWWFGTGLQFGFPDLGFGIEHHDVILKVFTEVISFFGCSVDQKLDVYIPSFSLGVT